MSSRWRLVQQQNDGVEHVSSVVIGRDELAEQLRAELELHLGAGWELGEWSFVLKKGDVVRRIGVRRFSPFDDRREEKLR